jgi:hypothetical protein
MDSALVMDWVMDSALVLDSVTDSVLVMDLAPAPAPVHHNWPEPDYMRVKRLKGLVAVFSFLPPF